MSPLALIIAGPNGSGKSSTINVFQSSNQFDFPGLYINADDIAREVRTSGFSGTEAELNLFAFNEARRLRALYREESQPHAMETVFSHSSALVDMELLKQAGFQLVLIFVCTRDPQINIHRVRDRVRRGGHNIVESKIVERYFRSFILLPRAIELAHFAYLFDNSGKESVLQGYASSANWTQANDELPPFLTDRLVTPLNERAAEREYLASLSGDAGIESPFEESTHRPSPSTPGRIYTGPVIHAGQHYALQEIEEDGEPVLYRHDSIWMQDRLTQEHVGRTVSIQYWTQAQSNQGILLP